jgi:hypothetical protein
MPAAPDAPQVVVLVAELPCGSRVQIELTLRLSSLPPSPPKSLPVVVA